MVMDGQNMHHVAVVACQHGCVDKGQIHSSHWMKYDGAPVRYNTKILHNWQFVSHIF